MSVTSLPSTACRPLILRLFSKRLSLAIIFSILVSFVQAQNSSLVFDGIDDFVECGNDPVVSATNIKTMECWAKFANIPFQCELISKSVINSGIELLVYNGNLSFYCMYDGGHFSYIDYPTSNIIAGKWYHLAVSFNGTSGSMKLYVNGVPVGTRTDVNDIDATGVSDPAASTLKLGNWSYTGFTRYFPGVLDEVRIWSIERSASDIKNGMYGTVATNTAGLTAYYKSNEGTGTTVDNTTGNASVDGILTNGTAWAASPVQSGTNAVSLDGVDDYAAVPTLAAYDFTSGTLECRIKPASLSVANDCFLASRGPGGVRYSFYVNNTQIIFNNGTSSQAINTTLIPGNTYQISLVANGTTIDLYVNGALKGTFTQTFGGVTGQRILLGTSDPDIVGNPENFEGSIDEVRIWSSQRTAGDILASISTSLVGNEAGLIGLFNFDQGIADGDNTGLTTIVDNTSSSNNASLFNLALTGTSSNYVTQLVVLPVRLALFDVYANGQTALVKWQTTQEQNSLRFDVERSADGVNFIKAGSVDAAGNSSALKNYSFTDYNVTTGKNYYRLKQIDLDGKFVYTQVKSLSISAPSDNKLSWTLGADKSVIVSLLKGSHEKYQLIDLNGRVISKGNLENGKVRISNLRTGRYNLMIEGNASLTIAFIVP